MGQVTEKNPRCGYYNTVVNLSLKEKYWKYANDLCNFFSAMIRFLAVSSLIYRFLFISNIKNLVFISVVNIAVVN